MLNQSGLDFHNQAVQAFGRDCATSENGIVDYSRYLARRKVASHGSQKFVPLAGLSALGLSGLNSDKTHKKTTVKSETTEDHGNR